MNDNITYLLIMWVAAFFFVVIGIGAARREEPMWLWSGSKIPADSVSDVKAYNHANGKMWCIFSIPLWIAGIVEFLSPLLSVLFLILACTFGIGGIVWYYHKLEEKYIIK